MITPPPTFRPARRSLLSATLVATVSATLVSAGGCGTAENGLNSGDGGSVHSSSGATTHSSGSGGMTQTGAGGTTSGAGGGNSGGSLGVGTGGVVSAAGGATASGGAVSGSGGVGTGGSEPCVDVEPPIPEDWPEATCEKWATETEDCGADWFSEYCDASCGRCVPEGGGGGMGTGGTAPCVDVEPPPDPEWPGATCAEWATESTSCGEDWFADYCDVSCGRCVPEGGGTGGAAGVDCSGEGLPQVSGGEGFATRYWDCCQTHCSQFGGQRCGQDGVSGTGDSTSACTGGGSFACYSEAPYAVSDCLSYGHVAKANPNCGGCYRLEFTGTGHHNANDAGSKLIKGKQMVVKVSNTGSDVAGNQFDLMIPGGGVGQFNACSRQWGTDDLGAQYGGFLTDCTGSHAEKKECVRQECMKIPAGDARDGCLWFVDWFEVADNPNFTSQPTDCPF